MFICYFDCKDKEKKTFTELFRNIFADYFGIWTFCAIFAN